MKPAQVLDRLDRTLAGWRRRIDAFEDRAFQLRPASDSWCAGQVAHHVALASDYLLDNALACARGEGERGRWAALPALMFAVGSFPPIRIRLGEVPPDVEPIRKPDPVDREWARRLLERVEERMRGAADAVAEARPDLRREHFTAGWFNGHQWFQSVEMHARHHLRQLDRLARDAGRPTGATGSRS